MLWFGGRGFKPGNLAGLKDSDRHAIPKENPIRRNSRNTRTRGENPREVQRIHSAQDQQSSVRGLFAHRAQLRYRFGQSKLLTADSADKISATDLSSRLQTPVNATQIVPRNVQRFSFQKSSKYDAITTQQATGEDLDRRVLEVRSRSRAWLGAVGPPRLAGWLCQGIVLATKSIDRQTPRWKQPYAAICVQCH